MCEVIALTPRAASYPAPLAGGAEILFFTGVRYQRLSDEEFAKVMARKPARPAKKASAARQARRQA